MITEKSCYFSMGLIRKIVMGLKTKLTEQDDFGIIGHRTKTAGLLSGRLKNFRGLKANFFWTPKINIDSKLLIIIFK